MADYKNRIGHDNFVWWIGVVEDRVDPLNVGRCKVRIFGSHTDNLQEIPTSDLPWATPLYPVNDSRTFSTPMEGDYVFGFFMDGLSSQAPAMLGVFPSIPQQDVDAVAGKGFYAKAKFTNSDIKEKDAVKPVVYTDTPAMKPVRVGSPTTPIDGVSSLGFAEPQVLEPKPCLVGIAHHQCRCACQSPLPNLFWRHPPRPCRFSFAPAPIQVARQP